MITQIRTLARRMQTVARIVGWREALRMVGTTAPHQAVEFTGSPERVLVIAPHPDDEVFGCGGSLALRAQRGDHITIVYVCDGARGTESGHHNAALVTTRKDEAAAGRSALGISSAVVHYLDIPDGTAGAHEVTKGLRKLFPEARWDAIYAPWFGDEHPDHIASLNGVLGIAQPEQSLWLYEVWSPLPASSYVDMSSVLLHKELAAQAHASQLASRGYTSGVLGLNAYRGMQIGATSAEAFLRCMARDMQR
jgi:N-acetylglucosamine malate deacetylase 1